MKYLLDSNTCIQFINGRSKSIHDQIHARHHDELVLCSIVRGELLYGALLSRDPFKTMAVQQAFLSLFTSLPFDNAAADAYSHIRAQLKKQGNLIGSNDMQIAAIAIANNLILVTHNVREFSRVDKLAIEDWEV